MKKERQNVGIIVFPICETGEPPEDAKAGNVPFSNLVDILYSLYDNLYVITGNKQRVQFKKDEKMHILEVQHKGGAGFIARAINYFLTQLRLSLVLAKLSGKVKLWIFFIGAEALILPMVTARLLGKRVVLALTGFTAEVDKEGRDPLFKIVGLLFGINLALCNRMIAYSVRIVTERSLRKYRKKISIAGEHFLDLSQFRIQRPVSQRNNVAAYIGRFEEGKGILNFMQALSQVLDSRDNIGFLIGGDGPLRDRIKEYLDKANLTGQVNFTGWIPHDELPRYLNEVKLLVLPSYTEALPNIMLEAMACNTPVLTTTVGAIPDVIKDGETGFIMEDNSPDCIARNILRALEHPNLEQIAENACSLVKKQYTYEVTVERYREALDIG